MTYNAEEQYLDIMRDIMYNGVSKNDRTGTGTLSVFGRTIRHDYSIGVPLLTTKKMFVKGIVGELLWFISGDTNIKYLQDNGIHIWDEWADENGDLGPIYGKQLVALNGHNGPINQLENVIHSIKNDPYSRRHIISLWNPAELYLMALPPCHGLTIQFYVDLDKDLPQNNQLNDGKNGYLSISIYQRSADWFLGACFNIYSYSCLLYLICDQTNLRPKEMIYNFGDCHIYKNHIEQCKIQMDRQIYYPPYLNINHKPSINDYDFDDFILEDYVCHPAIKAEISV